jgi:tellurite resistance protein TerA
MGIDYTKRPAADPAPVSLSKVTLTKAAPTVSLTKQSGTSGLMRVNLNWNSGQSKGLFHKSKAIDLDLGCLFEFADGSKGVVQALGNTFTATARGASGPTIRLDGDDRSGSNTDGENLFIDLGQTALIKRIMVFALIYEGAANWAAANGVITLIPVSGPQVEVHLDEPRDGARICGVALLENVGGELVVRREVNYLDGAQRALDAAYGWGMNWQAGRK